MPDTTGTSPSTVRPGRLGFTVLGAFGAERDGLALPLGPRLQRTLLAILVVEAGHVVPVDRLIDLLWPEDPPGAAIASLQAYISQLRRLLEPARPPRAPAQVLVTQDPGYVLRAAGDDIDATRFQGLARQARLDLEAGDPAAAEERVEQALRLWRGVPLVEFTAQPWAVPTVTRLTEARDLALEDRIDAWLALGRHPQAVSELEDMVAARPLRERRWGQLMIASYRSGRQSDALRAYQRCRALLGEELGLEPGPGLREIEAAILAQDPSLDWRPPAAAETVTAGRVAAGADGPAGGPPRAAAAPSLPYLVGREAEIARVRERLLEAVAGRGGAVVLAGEPGAGKTTLAEAVARLAADAGAATVWGRCLDAASTPAYWPWSQLLHALPDGAQVSAASKRLGGEADVLPPGDADSARQFRAYQALASALREATARAPLLAVIDDLHAADEASLGLLQLLAGDLRRMPALLLFTVRDTDSTPPLELALGELLRHPGAEQVTVGALPPADVATLVERLTGAVPRADVVAALIDRTGGNPFYASELIRLLTGERRQRPLTAQDVAALDVPAGIRDVLARRVHRLPDDTRSLLTVSAVVGRDLVPELLERVTGLDTEELLLNLEPAVAAGLLAPGAVGWGFRFRHPLIHESLRASASPVERARLHARIGAALEGLPADPADADHEAQLAHHYAAAGPFGDQAKAVRYSRRAAARAVRQGAWPDAVRLLEQALTAISPALTEADPLRCDVLVELGRAQRSASRIREAHRAFDDAIRLADQIGDEDRVLTAAAAFAMPALWGSRDWGETDGRLIALLERQLDRIDPGDDERRVRVLSALAAELNFGESAERGWALAQEALVIARRLGRPEELSAAVSACQLTGLAADHVAERREIINEMLKLPETALTPLVWGVLEAAALTELIRFGDLARFDAEFPRAWRLASDLHSRELQAQLRLVQAARYLTAGDAELGSGFACRGFDTMKEAALPWRQPSGFILECSIMLITGTLADNAARLSATLSQPEHPSLPYLVAPAAALGFAQAGDVAQATEITERWFTPPPRSWAWIQGIAHWAQVAMMTGAPDPGWLLQVLAPHAGELAIVGAGVDCGGAVDSLLAGLAWRLGRSAEAAARARSGLALETRVGASQWVTRTRALLRQVEQG